MPNLYTKCFFLSAPSTANGDMNAYNLQAAYGTAHQLLGYDQTAAAANSELAIGRKALPAVVRD